jgi:hypothetical protein
MRQVGFTQAQSDKFFGNYPIPVGLRGGEEATNVCINQVGVCVNVSQYNIKGIRNFYTIFTVSQSAMFLDRPVTYTFPAAFTNDPALVSSAIKIFVNFDDGKGEREVVTNNLPILL